MLRIVDVGIYSLFLLLPWDVDRGSHTLAKDRYYQLLSGHAAIGPYLKDKIRRTDDDRCWWCAGGKQQTRHHLFTECRAWLPQIRRL